MGGDSDHQGTEDDSSLAAGTVALTAAGLVGSIYIILRLTPSHPWTRPVRVRQCMILAVACGDALFALIKFMTSITLILTEAHTTAALCKWIGPVGGASAIYLFMCVACLAHRMIDRLSPCPMPARLALRSYMIIAVAVAVLSVSIVLLLMLSCPSWGWTTVGSGGNQGASLGLCDFYANCRQVNLFTLVLLSTLLCLAVISYFRARLRVRTAKVHSPLVKRRNFSITQYYMCIMCFVVFCEIAQNALRHISTTGIVVLDFLFISLPVYNWLAFFWITQTKHWLGHDYDTKTVGFALMDSTGVPLSNREDGDTYRAEAGRRASLLLCSIQDVLVPMAMNLWPDLSAPAASRAVSAMLEEFNSADIKDMLEQQELLEQQGNIAGISTPLEKALGTFIDAEGARPRRATGMLPPANDNGQEEEGWVEPDEWSEDEEW